MKRLTSYAKNERKYLFVRYELAYKLYCIINAIDVINFLEYNGRYSNFIL